MRLLIEIVPQAVHSLRQISQKSSFNGICRRLDSLRHGSKLGFWFFLRVAEDLLERSDAGQNIARLNGHENHL